MKDFSQFLYESLTVGLNDGNYITESTTAAQESITCFIFNEYYSGKITGLSLENEDLGKKNKKHPNFDIFASWFANNVNSNAFNNFDNNERGDGKFNQKELTASSEDSYLKSYWYQLLSMDEWLSSAGWPKKNLHFHHHDSSSHWLPQIVNKAAAAYGLQKDLLQKADFYMEVGNQPEPGELSPADCVELFQQANENHQFIGISLKKLKSKSSAAHVLNDLAHGIIDDSVGVEKIIGKPYIHGNIFDGLTVEEGNIPVILPGKTSTELRFTVNEHVGDKSFVRHCKLNIRSMANNVSVDMFQEASKPLKIVNGDGSINQEYAPDAHVGAILTYIKTNFSQIKTIEKDKAFNLAMQKLEKYKDKSWYQDAIKNLQLKSKARFESIIEESVSDPYKSVASAWNQAQKLPCGLRWNTNDSPCKDADVFLEKIYSVGIPSDIKMFGKNNSGEVIATIIAKLKELNVITGETVNLQPEDIENIISGLTGIIRWYNCVMKIFGIYQMINDGVMAKYKLTSKNGIKYDSLEVALRAGCYDLYLESKGINNNTVGLVRMPYLYLGN